MNTHKTTHYVQSPSTAQFASQSNSEKSHRAVIKKQ